MKTIIKLYDNEPIYNVLITAVLNPEIIIYVVDNQSETENRNSTLFFLSALNPPVNAVFYKTDTSDIDSILFTLEEITKQHPECILDVTGGEDLVLLATGLFCAKHNIPACYYNKKTNKYNNVFKSENIIGDEQIDKFKIKDFISLAGGAMVGHGHFSVESSGLSEKEIDVLCDRALKYQKHWKALVLGLQQSKNELDEFAASIPFYVAGSKVQSGMLYDFENEGLIHNLNIGVNKITFTYKNIAVKKCMTDTGLWLELYTYNEARKKRYFNDQSLSVLIDWDGDELKEEKNLSELKLETNKYRPVIVPNTINEIDVILVKGISPLFVSCKTGSYNIKELKSEIGTINTITKRFGGQSAKPVLVTTSDLSKIDPFLYKRCWDMGVFVIEGGDLRSGKMGKRLVEISENTYRYKEIL